MSSYEDRRGVLDSFRDWIVREVRELTRCLPSQLLQLIFDHLQLLQCRASRVKEDLPRRVALNNLGFNRAIGWAG
jgi:hypothetical protein